MNVEEQRLAQWLQEITPEPRRALSVDDIAARVEHARAPHRPHNWLPLLAAACVVALVAALVLALRGTGSTRPAHPTPSRVPTTTPTAVHTSSSPTGHKTPHPPALPVDPWGATRITDLDLRPDSMVGYRGRLYALDQSGELVDIDPVSGRVVASTAPAAGTTQIDDLVVSSGSVWTVGVAEGGGVRVEQYDATTLRPEAGAKFGGANLNAGRYGTLLGAEPGRPWVLVGGGRTVHLLDDTLSPVRTFTVPDGQISDFATSPDGARLYVSSGPESAQRIYVVDVHSGKRLGTVDLGPGATGGLVGLRASAGGLFVTSAEGHVASVLFAPLPSGRSGATAFEGSGGGGFLPQATLSGGVAWIGGTRLGCANPTDGRLRATTQVDPGKADVSSMTVVHHRVYAVYQGSGQALVELHPPAACGVR